MFKFKHLHIIGIIIILVIAGCNQYKIYEFEELNCIPELFPDYTEIVIPPNIAPLNFRINEKGDAYVVKISGTFGKPITIKSKDPSITINIKKWHELLKSNTGGSISIQVYIKHKAHGWQKFSPATIKIAPEKIESYLAYRLINAGYEYWNQLGLYQRNLENFDEFPIILNSSVDQACMNCHTFYKNDVQKMIIHLRGSHAGTLLINGNSIRKIDTKTNYTMSSGVYSSWHPNGKLIAFSVNIIGQNFTSSKTSRIEVSDKASDIILYNIETNTITTSPKVSTKSRENLPVWSHDGKWLYYISAPEATDFTTRIYDKYDLLRIAYDAQSNTWGDIDTILTSKTTGLSISFPKISPDGNFLMFCMSDYGYFTIHHGNSDLYLMNLNTKEYHKLDVNSSSVESYHSWSLTNRWFVFASKRIDGLYSRPYICYIDKQGKTSKPFVIPQRDPDFYSTFLKNFNLPELVKSKVNPSELVLRDISLTKPVKATFDSMVDIDALSGATYITKK